ncbi:hypothetical protein [Facklamia hominis]|uniref:Uncharacterized protein n=2 Tax=Facklamia hominis TaxID=178214 RepID=K1MGI5_9LACT|nr:hypothetical protein HMPREF9706_01334 [Facklamia hominis CCUG 36813]
MMSASLHYLRMNLYRLFQLRYFIGVLLIIYLLTMVSFMIDKGDAWAYFAIHDKNVLSNNMNWLSFYVFPLLIPFNFFGQVLVQDNPFDFIRIRHPKILFLLSVACMGVYVSLYVFLSILLAFFFQVDNVMPLTDIISLFIHLLLSIWGMLSLQVAIHCLGFSVLGLVLNLGIIVHSFYSQFDFTWIMTDPFTQMTVASLLGRLLILLLIIGLTYTVYNYLPRLKIKSH